MALNAQQSAITNRISNTRRAFKKWHFNLCFKPKKIEIDEVDQKLFYFDNKEKIRYILQYHYDKGKNVAQICEKICAIYAIYEDTLSKSTARKWFARFRAGNFDMKDEPRSGWPITEKFDEIMVKVERDKHVSTGDCQGTRHRPQKQF